MDETEGGTKERKGQGKGKAGRGMVRKKDKDTYCEGRGVVEGRCRWVVHRERVWESERERESLYYQAQRTERAREEVMSKLCSCQA